jgi:hypothetical protein
MKVSRIFFGLGIIVLIFLAAFAVPKFNFTIYGQTILWPGLEFKDLGINTHLGTFNHGKDLYPSHEVVATPELSTDPSADNAKFLNNDVNLVRLRMDLAGLYDVDLFTRYVNGAPSLVFHFPEYYTDQTAQNLAQLLLAPAQIKFVEHDPAGDASASSSTLEGALINQLIQGYIEKTSELNASDIQSITLESRVSLGGQVLRIKFTDAAATRLRAALDRVSAQGSNSPKPLIMVIDGQPQFYFIDLGQNNEVIAAPMYDLFTSSQLQIVSTFPPILPPLQLAYNTPTSSVIPNVYAPEGHAFLAWTFVITTILTLIWMLRNYSKRRLFVFALNFAAFILVSVFILKLATVAISTGLIIGFILMYIVGVITIHTVVTSVNDFKAVRLRQRDVAIFLFLVSALLYMSNLIFGEFQNLLGGVSLMSAVLVFTFMVPVRIFTEAQIGWIKFRRKTV